MRPEISLRLPFSLYERSADEMARTGVLTCRGFSSTQMAYETVAYCMVRAAIGAHGAGSAAFGPGAAWTRRRCRPRCGSAPDGRSLRDKSASGIDGAPMREARRGSRSRRSALSNMSTGQRCWRRCGIRNPLRQCVLHRSACCCEAVIASRKPRLLSHREFGNYLPLQPDRRNPGVRVVRPTHLR